MEMFLENVIRMIFIDGYHKVCWDYAETSFLYELLCMTTVTTGACIFPRPP